MFRGEDSSTSMACSLQWLSRGAECQAWPVGQQAELWPTRGDVRCWWQGSGGTKQGRGVHTCMRPNGGQRHLISLFVSLAEQPKTIHKSSRGFCTITIIAPSIQHFEHFLWYNTTINISVFTSKGTQYSTWRCNLCLIVYNSSVIPSLICSLWLMWLDDFTLCFPFSIVYIR